MAPDADRAAVRDAVRLADLHVAARAPLDSDVPSPPPPAAAPPTPAGPATARPLRPGTILVPREARPIGPR